MTNPSGPSGSHGAEGESEKKKWGYKREQFDAVITKTRFNGAIERLIAGTVEVKALLGVLDELNGSSQQGRYMAEMLALKKESRLIGTASFSPAVAEFLIEGSRRIPVLSDGLASQMAVTLAAAADNLDYLDTVNEAVGNLLLDLDHPLRPDTRNYLRALTDKIDATRRLQQARAQLSTVPSVYPPASSDLSGQPSTPKPAPVISVGEAPPSSAEVAPVVPRPRPAPPEHAPPKHAQEELPRFHEPELDNSEPELDSALDEAHRDTLATAPLPFEDDEEATKVRHPQTPAEPPSAALGKTLVMPATAPVAVGPVTSPTIVDPDEGVVSEPARTQPGLGAPTPGVIEAKSAAQGQRVIAPVAPNESGPSEEPIEIPTRHFPLGLSLTVLGLLLSVGLGTYLYLSSKTNPGASPEPSANASASASAALATPDPDAKAKRRERAKRRRDKVPEPGAVAKPEPTPAPIPAQPQAPASPSQPVAPATVHEAPVAPSPPAHAPTRVKVPAAPLSVSPPRTAPRTSGNAPSTATTQTKTPPASEPKVAAPVSDPGDAPNDVPRTPKASKDIDQILAELRQVPGDAAHIEAKAYEVSRIVARSAKSEAEHILGRLLPEELLFGTEAYDTRALEPMRRVVALLLQKVAVDKDDGRAAIAIEILGDWAVSRKHGAAAKLTLDDLAESPVVLARPRRRIALQRVQARLGTAPSPGE